MYKEKSSSDVFFFLSECAPSGSFYVVFNDEEISDRHGLLRSGFKCTRCKKSIGYKCFNCTFCMAGTHSNEITCVPCPAGNFIYCN